MFYEDYGQDVYIFEEQTIEEIQNNIEFTTLEEYKKLTTFEKIYQQKSLYQHIKSLKNDYLKNICIKELSNSLVENCDEQLVIQVYDDILDTPLNDLPLQLLSKSSYVASSDIPEVFLQEFPHSVNNKYAWIDKGDQIQYGLEKPCILIYTNVILGMQKTFNKTDLKCQVDLVYYNNQLYQNQTVYFEQKGIRIMGQQFSKLEKFYVYQQSNNIDNTKTKLCKKLSKKGLIHSLLIQLAQEKFENKSSVNMLLYECLLFENQDWCQRIISQDWLNNLITLCLEDPKDISIFHQVVYDNLLQIDLNYYTEQQVDQLLLRLHQYYEANSLDLKQKKVEKQPPKKVEEPPKTTQQTTNSNNKQKGSKPKGIGYGDINYSSTYQSQQKKKEVQVLDSDLIYQQAEGYRWKILNEIFKKLKHLNLDYILMIEDSCLIPVIKSIISSLSKSQTISDKFEVIQIVFVLLNKFLTEEAMHLFTCKDYGDISLFEVIQKVNNESVFIQNKEDQELNQKIKQNFTNQDTQLSEVLKELQDFFNKLIIILEQNKYIDVKFEETETQQIQDPAYLYPMIMKPLVLRTSEVIKQAGWKKQLEEAYSHLSSSPPNKKMNRIIKELSDIGENLPLQLTNSIFLRYDKDRMDAMQAMIFGSSGTPYAHGAFLYNFLFCDDYPSRPPKCLLETTGHGKVRFNPNLYNCGKVCLSLLGTWGDNWKPNESTLWQILISIQAMVMSEYVYFNEPGWESSMGTVDGEKNNRGYCNIVKLANIRYAMIEQLQKPPVGFEEVIQKSFYLRKDVIIKEVQQWIDEADLPVNYHCTQNHNISAPFQQQPQKFKSILTAEFEALKKELEKLKVCITHQSDKKILSIIQRQSYTQIQQEKKKQHDKKKEEISEFLKSQLPEIDVSESNVSNRQFDIQNAEVQNLMSRYIGVMGLDSVSKQSQASVIIYGLGALGIETAKNLVLSGLKRLTIIEDKKLNNQGQFFVQNEDSTRLEQSLLHLQGLNPYVQIDYSNDIIQSIKSQNYQVVCLCEVDSLKDINIISQICREYKIGMIVSQLVSVYGRILIDLGDQFIVNDADGEQVQEFIIENIDQEQGIIEIKGKHNLSPNDVIELKEIIQENGKSLNNQQLNVVKVINKSTIFVGDLSQFGKYLRNGRGQTVKQKIVLQNKQMSTIIIDPIFDPNFILDEQKFTIINEQMNRYSNQSGEINELFQKTGNQIFPPQAAYLGGIVCQEIIKAITHKYMPIRQCYFHTCEELLDGNHILGKDLQQAIEKCKVLLIGAGAIGCELLKNYAMIGLGINGNIIVTDPDVIEKSNLSRQFLFREKHLRQPKSYTAARACMKMNPQMKIVARLDKISPQTERLYTNVFQYVDIITNALDNVQARLYVDSQCIEHMKPLLESGTLGPKGHVQVILPNLTESYGSKQDPEENNEIPYCTLKMFPEDSNHCLEWARDKFEKLFTTKLQQIRQTFLFKDFTIEGLETTLKFCKNMPKNFNDCIQYALNKFYKYFVYGIMDLLKAYPLDHVVNGKLFWSSPKRPPQIFEFKGEEMQMKFIQSVSQLYATALGIEIPQQIDYEQTLKNIKPKEYKENKEKLQQIQDQVQKDAQAKVQEEGNQDNQQQSQQELINQIIEYFQDYYEKTDSTPKLLKSLDFLPQPIQFEKDEDDNHHVEFIQAALNCRAQNYGLEPLDWLTTKLKAGRIVPAMATTTACIAGLQTIELVKVIKKLMIDENLKLETFKNMFLNLAIPYALQSEPGECQYEQINCKNFSFWSRWDVHFSSQVNNLERFITYTEQVFGEKVTCIKQKAKLLYSPIMFNSKEEEQNLLQTPIYLLFEIQDFEEYVELDITFQKRIKCRFYY
ncbi:unnamed protein product [Paramecium pentaurelia]|uniref:UBC core domain-containing protein n=1 Tax=Paramecium pentaurelia TaxID=43138 RepID=A0A8S1UHK7_9CILI|nr:unnamed protein product [Paramecium pentaurelia]